MRRKRRHSVNYEECDFDSSNENSRESSPNRKGKRSSRGRPGPASKTRGSKRKKVVADSDPDEEERILVTVTRSRRPGPASKTRNRGLSNSDDSDNDEEQSKESGDHSEGDKEVSKPRRPGPASKTRVREAEESDNETVENNESSSASEEESNSGKSTRPGPASSKKIGNGDVNYNSVRNGEERKYRPGPASSKRKQMSDSEDEDTSSNKGGQLLFSTIESSQEKEDHDSDNVNDDKEEQQKPESWWQPESGVFQEKGPHLRGFKFLKLKVQCEDKHLLVSHVAKGNGNIKCNIKMKNVAKQMKIPAGAESIVVETRTAESHPFICPFADPNTNEPCSAAFKKSEQKYFTDHVIKGKCPFSQLSQMTAMIMDRKLTCDVCGDHVAEDELEQHVETKHLTHTCPACKSKHEERMDVEDHIINEHATHFMSMLASVYRKANKMAAPPPPDTTASVDDVMERSEYQTLEDLIKEKKEQEVQEAKEKEERERMFKEQARYLASLKGANQQRSANQLMNRLISPMTNSNIRPAHNKLVIPRQQPQQQMPVGSNVLAKGESTGPPQLQQVKLSNGQTMWALVSNVVENGKSKQVYKVISKVVPGQPPPTVIFQPNKTITSAAPAAANLRPCPPPRPPTTNNGHHRPAMGEHSASILKKHLTPGQHNFTPAPGVNSFTPNRVIRPVIRPVNTYTNNKRASPVPMIGGRASPALTMGVSPLPEISAYNRANHNTLASVINRGSPVTSANNRQSPVMMSNPGASALLRMAADSRPATDHDYGGQRPQEDDEVMEVEEKDPLALDDEPSIEELDPFTDDVPIIPVVNPDVDKDLAAEEDNEDDEDPPLDMSNFLQAQVLIN